MSDIIGSGLAFPLSVNHRGGIALARGEEDIEQAIALILGTAPGERPMRPEFGCEIHQLVFDTIDAEMIGRMDTAIRVALDRWEPRIEVTSVDFDLTGAVEGRLEIYRRLSRPRDQPGPQPRLPVLRDPGGGAPVSLPADQARRSALPGAGLGGAAPHRPELPGMDRAQRLRPRDHADRAVRVDDRHADLPGQPGAGQAPRRAARAARHRAPRTDGGADATCASGWRRRPISRSRSRPAAPRSRRCGRRPTSRSCSKSRRISRSRR